MKISIKLEAKEDFKIKFKLTKIRKPKVGGKHAEKLYAKWKSIWDNKKQNKA